MKFSKLHSSIDHAKQDTIQIYRMIFGACIFIHLCYAFLFYFIQVEPLVWFDIASTILYILLLFFMRQDKEPLPLLLVAFIEILVHAVAATFLLGWDYGFPLQIIALIPIAFYAPFQQKYAPHVYSLITLLVFFVLRVLTLGISPIYTSAIYSAKEFFYLFNASISILAMTLFSSLFYTYVQDYQQELARKNRTLQKLAGTDPLTGMRNRRSMIPKLEKGIERRNESGKDFSILLCDIDNFKSTNDKFGHDCGDYILQTIARIIPAHLDAEDYLCRWGGEEFLIMLSDADINHATYVADAIRLAISDHPFQYNGKRIPTTITIGLASSYGSVTINDMLQEADQNLYRGKRSGKNCVITGYSKTSL